VGVAQASGPVLSLASLDDAHRRRHDKPDWVVGRERRIDCRRSAKTHVRPQVAHPLGGAVAGDLSDVRRTPTFRAASYKPNARIKEAGCALDDLLLAHLDLDYRIRRPGGPAGNK